MSRILDPSRQFAPYQRFQHGHSRFAFVEAIKRGEFGAARGQERFASSDRQFLGLVAKVLPGWFPHLPEQSQYNRRLRRLAPVLAGVQLRIAELIAAHDLVIADGVIYSTAALDITPAILSAMQAKAPKAPAGAAAPKPPAAPAK